MASDDEEVCTPLWCPSIQDYLYPWLHRLDNGTIDVAWVSAAEWAHRDQHRVEYGGLTPCSDPSEPPADELLAIESDADETSGGNDADEGRGDSFAFDSDTDGYDGFDHALWNGRYSDDDDADDAGPDVTGDGKGEHDGELDGEAEVEMGTADVDVAASVVYVKPLIV